MAVLFRTWQVQDERAAGVVQFNGKAASAWTSVTQQAAPLGSRVHAWVLDPAAYLELRGSFRQAVLSYSQLALYLS
jgi:hypothetical protein